ncbi:MAG: biosynthetic-type acetolactate synthase large subunit [Verrucomicrobia bacterium]|nr:biosynthetic-type acetolactate synthase large subunit [Verrucomicrobiota bacterium]
MSKTATAAARKKSAANVRQEIGPAQLGRDILVEALEREGVEVIFAYPGGASMEIHQSLTHSKKIRTILPRHEQGGSFAAEGYARASGKPGVCMATSGPGATNLVTAIADAYMDSVPLIAITGQVPQVMIGKGAFQETDFFGMTLPVVKHSYLITDINDIPRVVKEAFHIAQSGRPGPVVIDFPKNLQQSKTQPVWPASVDLPGYPEPKKADDIVLNEILGLIEKAERPVLYVGGGVITGEASKELVEFAERARIPVTTTIMGVGAFPETHELSLRWLGMHGAAYANWAVSGEFEARRDPTKPMVKLKEGADLLLAFGVRFDDRVTGKVDKFCETGTIVHVDIDPSEHNKNRKVQLAIQSDVKYLLRRLNEMTKRRPISKKFTAWHQQIAEWKERAPLAFRVTEEVITSDHMKDHLAGREHEVILPQHAIALLYELTGGEAIVTTGVGQHQMWAGQWYKFKRARQFITSAGLGAMGFGYPAALGAKVAHPDKQVVDIDGDGSFIMNVQELATAHIENIAAKALLLNNQHLGMVMQWEDNFFAGNRGHTYLGDPKNRPQIYPDFVKMAESFNVPAERVMLKSQLRAAMKRMLDAETPYLLDVITPYSEHVLPFIPAGRTVADMIWK